MYDTSAGKCGLSVCVCVWVGGLVGECPPCVVPLMASRGVVSAVLMCVVVCGYLCARGHKASFISFWLEFQLDPAMLWVSGPMLNSLLFPFMKFVNMPSVMASA